MKSVLPVNTQNVDEINEDDDREEISDVVKIGLKSL